MSTFIKLNVKPVSVKPVSKVAIALLLTCPLVISNILISNKVFGQSIVPANDLGTKVNVAPTNAQQLNITGGIQAGANLYHSFQQFGLNQGQIANFLSNSSIQNILGRVVGGSPSVINGLIQVTGGNSNLYLLNPAGIIFGANASLNVPASFTATTANGIQIGNGWFGINTSVDAIKNLSGNPQAFGFAANSSLPNSPQGAPVANAGNLSVNQGQSITLVGGLVINTGTIAAPSGKITIAAVPDGKYVKITPEGSLLSLELPVAAQKELAQRAFLVSDLPALLTGYSVGTAIASGIIDVSSATSKGGEINVLGDRVGLVSANLNASGAIGGGQVLIGGDFQGKGTVPNAQYTFVSQDSTIHADALSRGTGGKVIIWSDRSTTYLGSVFAQGGVVSGNGGFVEVSGKENLLFRGKVNTTALNGIAGTLLLDPNNITISGAASDLGVAAQLLLAQTPTISSAFQTGTDINIQDVNLRSVAGNLILQATNNIILDNTTDFQNTQATSITFQAGNNIQINVPNNFGSGFDITGGTTQSLKFIAGNNIKVDTSAIDTQAFSFSFRFSSNTSPTITLTAQNGNVNIDGNFLILNAPTQSGVTLNLNAPNGAVLVNNGFLRAGQVNLTTDSVINITAGRLSVTGTPLNGSPGSAAQDTRYSIYTFAANAGLGSQGNVSLQFGNAAPIISGNGGNNLINIRLLKDTNFVVGKTPTTSGVDGQIGIGIGGIPPQVLTLLSDQSFSSSINLGTNLDVIVASRNDSQCEPIKTKKPILTVTASLPSEQVVATRTVPTRNANSSNLPPCKE